MQYRSISSFLLILAIVIEITGAFDPCQGRSSIGGTCDYNVDCTGFAVICKSGKCDCHPFYQVKNDSDGSKYCAKLPDTIGAPCTQQCRFPMFCNQGKCQCVRATADGNRCLPSTKLGDSCSQDAECTLPFSACISGRCSCVAGSTAGNGQCQAAPHCPDGSKATGNCVRLSYDRSSIENRFTQSGQDTCPANSYCMTSDTSLGGFCCPITCPYNTQPSSDFSCAPNTTAKQQCPSDTHYCHRLAGQTFSISACCRRPCKDPMPVFVNGKCFARSYLGGACSANEQCEGGDTMQCNSGTCTCKSGFTPQSGSFISSKNPPQICVRSCSSGAARGGECFASASLGGQCDVDDQCPSNSRCWRGQCLCSCDNGYVKSGSSCVKVTSTTQSSNGGNGGTGVTNSGNGGILGLFGGLLKGNGGSSGGSSGGILG